MSNPQLHPLEINPKTGELFLRLRHHKNIILTPPRLEDAPAFVPYMNDPKVHEWLAAPPFPYKLEHGEEWVRYLTEIHQDMIQKLESAKDDPDLIFINSPVRFIREVKEDGSDIFIGDLGLVRYSHGELMGPEAGIDWDIKAKWEEENNKLPIGDPNIIWSIGDFLAPSHHRQGIMTDVVDTLIHEWAIPHMGVRHIRVEAFIGNEGSTKVFLKNGFRLIGTYEDHMEVKGRKRGIHVLEWKLEE